MKNTYFLIVLLTVNTDKVRQFVESKIHKGRDPEEEALRGQASFETLGTLRRVLNCPAGHGGAKCRQKRDASPMDMDLETERPLLGFTSTSVRLRLRRSVGLVAPHYQLVVRDDDRVEVNRTVTYPTCLFEGHADGGEGGGEARVAISTCRGGHVNGLLLSENGSLVIEQVTRSKRSADEEDLVVVYQSEATGGQCGIKAKNLKRMRAPKRKVVLLGEDKDDSTDPGKKRRRRRRKRSSSTDKAIELAVFVDDDLYRKEKKAAGDNDPIAAIQDLVFTYLNSVQLLYNSNKLSTQFRIILVRLEIFRLPLRAMDKAGGDIEKYLDSFCWWQKEEKQVQSSQDDSGYWDHGLLLTGLDLFDGKPKYDTVIGLAWVSGMCNDGYSCTINEGSNFESVYVIAHEMGHNLGMNHDGERQEGNNCDPDKFLMSPILGPGKVTWSSCSNNELEQFLDGRADRSQAECLEDLPEVIDQYDYLKEQIAPGAKVKSTHQCQKAFGPRFLPHVIPNEPPYEDLCRELWCANSTHAIRAHPALEGTDCSSKPWPYGSNCVGGSCVPFDPEKPLIPTYGSNGNSPSRGTSQRNGTSVTKTGNSQVIPDWPEWYDPIFARVFTKLKMTASERYTYPDKNAQVYVVPMKTLKRGRSSFVEFTDTGWSDQSKKWVVTEDQCPVECGGGWTSVTVNCDEMGREVRDELCETSLKPKVSRILCNIDPC